MIVSFRHSARIRRIMLLVSVVVIAFGCASVERRRSPSEGARAVLNMAASGRAAAPRHNLREWRLEIDTGGFFQLILSSSGYYMMRHGYFFADPSVGSGKTLMLSEVNIGTYSLRGPNLIMDGPAKSTCRQRIRLSSAIVMEASGQSLLMDESATRDFVLDEFSGRKQLPFHKQTLGSLDGSSFLPADEADDGGRFEARLGCVQVKPDGQVAFTPPEKQEAIIPATGVAH